MEAEYFKVKFSVSLYPIVLASDEGEGRARKKYPN